MMLTGLAGRIASEDHATLWATTIAVGARNGIEDLHAAGAFTDGQAPALNRRLRAHAYEVLVAIRQMDSTRDDDPFTRYLIELVDDWEQDPLCAALAGAIATAVWEFADAEGIGAETRVRLEEAAVEGALEMVDLYYRLDEPEARRQLAFLITSVPGYCSRRSSARRSRRCSSAPSRARRGRDP